MHCLAQIAIGRDDDAYVDTLLQRRQQPGLCIGRKLGDFVEKDRPAAREVERAFTVGKQLERAQARGPRRAVDTL